MFAEREFQGSEFFGIEPDWPDAEPEHVLAAAVGAAWAERERGGAVVAMLRDQTLHASGEALDLAYALEVPNLVILAVGGLQGQVRELMMARDWRIIDARSVQDFPAVPTVLVLEHAPEQRGQPARVRREWQPVHLPDANGFPLRVHLKSSPSAFNAVVAGLRDYARVETRLLLVQDSPGWSRAADTQAKLIAAAHAASEGFRVVWRVTGANQLLAWTGALREIGRRGLGLKILCSDNHMPPLCIWQALVGWWVVGPADAAETAAAVAQTLDTEDAAVISVPTALDPSIVFNQPSFEPGSGRWLAPMGSVNCICDQRSFAVALNARDVLAVIDVALGIYFCASLAPLPMSAIDQAAQRGPLVIVDAGNPQSGLGAVVTAALEKRPHPVECIGNGAAPSDIAQAVRTAMGR